MLRIDSDRWGELSHAYGRASDLPELLRQLEALPPDDETDAEPYFSLWSALCHQGDVYTGSYAALPHIVRIIASRPERAPWTLFQLVACIEIARKNGHGPDIPADLRDAYQAALEDIPRVVAAAAREKWDHTYCEVVLAALAAAKGFTDLAEALLELDSDTIQDLLTRKRGE